jgi:hypothetical protein
MATRPTAPALHHQPLKERWPNLVSGLRIHLPIPDTVAGLFIDLVEADFFSLAAGGKQSNRTRYQREF